MVDMINLNNSKNYTNNTYLQIEEKQDNDKNSIHSTNNTIKRFSEEIIKNKEQILANSFYEIEIRANTVVVVEFIKKELKETFNKDAMSVQIDYILWNEGENARKNIKPHHRTLTIFY